MTSTHTGIAHQPRGQATIEYLPLEEVRVKAWVVDVSSRIVLTQTFYNPSNEPTARAKYVFPLPENAAVCAFELELEDGSVIIGEVKEKEEAALAFTRAVEQGKTSALVERVTDDIFTISVGSIPATTRVIAHLTFVMDLLNEALRDHVRLQLPMHIAERYGTPPAAMHDASAVNSRTRVHISVDIQTSDVIYDIRSPTHRIALRRYKGRSDQRSQRRMSAVWKSSEFLTDNFVITIHAEGLDKPRCFAEVLDARRDDDEEGSIIAMQLTLVPKFQAPKVPSQEYIFIIDRSGSMGGSSIETAKRTLTILLRLLPSTQTTFNIFSFGNEVTSLWRNSRGLDRTSLVEAVCFLRPKRHYLTLRSQTSHVATMSANLGGTEIPKALQSAFNSRGLDRPAVVFLLTDGQVNQQLDPWVVISNAVHNSPPRAPVRLFVLGIGTGVSSEVCSRLARQGNGEYLFALSAEDISGKCARLLNTGRSKNIERIEIHWGYDASSPRAGFSSPTKLNLPAGIPALAPPPPVQQAPHSLTNIFSGIRFTVFAITSFRTVPTSVTLKTKLEGVSEPQESTVQVMKVKPFRDTNEQSIVPIVHSLAARQLIMELDEGFGPLPAPAPGDALLVSEDDLRRAGIVRLGLTYQLVSKHTSFVAIQKGDERRRNMGRGSGSMAWARSRIRKPNPDTQQDSTAEAPTFLDDLVSGVSSIIASVFGLFSGPVASPRMANTTRSRPHHRATLPGTFDGSDSGMSESSRGRGPRRDPNPPRRRSASSHTSTDTFSTLSSLGGSSCSSCWTTSRPPSPLPRFRDPIERAPSPEFLQDTGAPGHARPVSHPSFPDRRVPISQEVYDLFQQMDVDGSFTVSPLLTRVVGDAVLGKADELRVDKKVWATVVVVAYMKIHLQGEPDLLELVSEKAREFVEAAGLTRGGARSFDQMVREAGALLNP
ncbi:VIT-domain-containing protein [Imleria badia]|nr:VIT-domain-containing protein [Imleria badia]